MFFPNRRTALGYLALLLPPLAITFLAFFTLSRLDEAEMMVDIPLIVTPDPLAEALSHFQTGITQQEAGNFAAAEQAYRAALTIDPTMAPVYNALGSLYVVMERPAAAIPFYQQATQLEPETAEFWRNLGIVQANQGQMAEAVAALETAIALSPDDAMLHYELGQVYAFWQRPEDARQAFSRVLALTANPSLAADAAEQLRLLSP